MPTERKAERVQQLSKLIRESTVAISADFAGMSVGMMTALRRALREEGVEFKVVKNSLTSLAADDAGKPLFKDLVEGQTAIAFGFEDATQPAKTLTEFIRNTRAPLRIMGGVLGDRALTAAQIGELAALPGREELIARLLGQLQAPISGLANVLSAPPAALARVLQRRIESVGEPEQPED